jgi:hypothetical protein
MSRTIKRLTCMDDPADYALMTVMHVSVHINSDTGITAERYTPRIGLPGTRVTISDSRGGGIVDLFLPDDEVKRFAQVAKEAYERGKD